MTPGDYLPTEDALLRSWLNNFYTQCVKYEEELGLDATELGILDSQTGTFDSNLTNVTAAKAELKSVVADKNSSKSTVIANVRGLVREFKSNPAVSPGILSALGVVGQPDSGPVVTVTGLTVLGCDDGVNKLKWNRNGNTSSTLFIIETKLPNQSAWIIAGAVTRTNFNHEDQTPGQTRLYRITSSRGGVNSAPSAPVIVYGDTGNAPLSIAA